VERRLAVLAGSNAQALTRRRVRRRAWLLALALVLVAGAAEAKPRRRDAKLAFDRGVTAYQKGNFEAASEALGKSFGLERDVDTLFAWAQSERKLEHYDKAIELYEKALTFNMPAANRSAIELNLEECRAMVAPQKPKVEAPPVEPKPAEPLAQEPRPQPATVLPPRVAERPPAAPEVPPVSDASSAARPWYKDPIALGLGGVGVVATGVGIGLLISAKSLDSDSKAAKNDYTRALDLRNQARLQGNIGGATAAVGVAALIGAAAWVVVHRKSGERAVTGWLAPGGGGLAVAGGF
jgi:tetratricopeptide (TPR) repeat protein